MTPKQIYERIRVNYRDAPFFTILRGNFTRLQGHKLGYE